MRPPSRDRLNALCFFFFFLSVEQNSGPQVQRDVGGLEQHLRRRGRRLSRAVVPTGPGAVVETVERDGAKENPQSFRRDQDRRRTDFEKR